ncbi:hypothetical protein ACH42_07485 [Endozoicomonas sp. (ex Bugula neritina AB1)]|nr:hypothetical protein ACH42_07485 [Endozoicomonas sp. (ex Bugula neritina AB1)]
MTDNHKKDEKVYLSETEERLIQDTDGSYREELLQQLYQEAIRLKALNDKGTSPEDFNKIDHILTGVVAAIEVVEKNWQKHHKKQP